MPSWITTHTRSTSEIARGAVSPLDPRNLPWDDFDNHLPSDEDHLWRVDLLLLLLLPHNYIFFFFFFVCNAGCLRSSVLLLLHNSNVQRLLNKVTNPTTCGVATLRGRVDGDVADAVTDSCSLFMVHQSSLISRDSHSGTIWFDGGREGLTRF